MPVFKKLINHLNSKNIKYELLKHKIVYTAKDKSSTLRISEKFIGKTLILKIDKSLGTVLLPANRNLDKSKFKKVARVKKIIFASEKTMKSKFKGVKVGAVPPLGNLWGFQTFVEKSLIKQPKVIISAGDYNCSIKIKGADLKKLIPDLIVGNFGKQK